MTTRRVSIDIGSRTIQAVVAEDDLWLSQRCMAEIFDTSPQNITMHIANLARHMDVTDGSRYFTLAQKEGQRTVERRLTHYSLEIAHAIALRTQRYDELNALMGMAGECGVLKSSYRIVPIRERNFAEILTSTLDGITSVITQHSVLGYLVDFYLPEFALAIEYDEPHHAKPSQIALDRKRQADIERALGVSFIRVEEGGELHGLNRVVKHIAQQIKRMAKKTACS